MCTEKMMHNFCFNVNKTFLVPFHHNFIINMLNCSLIIIDLCHICNTVQLMLVNKRFFFLEKEKVKSCCV